MKRLFSIAILVLTAGAAAAQDTNSADTATTWDSFQIIANRNIFDPNRVSSRPRRARPRVEAFTFCGGASDGPQAVAFFTGAGASSKPFKPGDAINGFTVGAITLNSVELKPAAGAALVLNVGSSVRRENGGPWAASEQAATVTETDSSDSGSSESATAAPASSSGDESDIIKRLKARREDN